MKALKGSYRTYFVTLVCSWATILLLYSPQIKMMQINVFSYLYCTNKLQLKFIFFTYKTKTRFRCAFDVGYVLASTRIYLFENSVEKLS